MNLVSWMKDVAEVQEETNLDTVRTFLAKGNWVVAQIRYGENNQPVFSLVRLRG